MAKNFSTFHRLISLFRDSFDALKITISAKDCEDMASKVHQVMSAKYRTYHSVDHVLEVCSVGSPLAKLAGIFHDIVYVQVDKRIHPLIREYTKGFDLEENFNLILPDPLSLDTRDPARDVYSVFGFSAGQPLTPFGGENEFLSAVVAVRALAPFLHAWERIQIIAYIEATIPFRKKNDQGECATRILGDRVNQLCKSKSLTVPTQEVDELLRDSVLAANIDVSSFGNKNTGLFISNTWELCLEGNPVFRNPLYSISQYRGALQKVEGFISNLKPEVIFRQFEGTPSESDYKALIKQAKINLSIQTEYLRAKLVEAGLCEAMVQLTGGDCPIALIFGELPMDGQHHASELDNYLNPRLKPVQDPARDPSVLEILKGGRDSASYFDFKHSPIAAYTYERLNHKEFTELSAHAKRFFSGDLSPIELLKLVPKNILIAIISAITEVAFIRKEALDKLRQAIMES